MWERFLTWLPTFSWILGGTLLFPGIVIGIYHSLNRIFGYSNDHLFGYSEKKTYLRNLQRIRKTAVRHAMGIIPLCILGIGVGSGVFWSLSIALSVKAITTNTIIGGILGLLAMLAIFPENFVHVIFSLSLFVVFGDKIGIPYERLTQRLMMIGGFWVLRYIITALALKVLPLEKRIDRRVSALITSFLILLRFKTIICNNCLRYTHPFKSQYETGKRYCEYCQGEVEFTKNHGKVVFTFGDFPQTKPEARIFLWSNPTFGSLQPESQSKIFFRSVLDLNQRAQPVDVSEVYIDTKTCDPRLIERFITYILHDPPEHGLQSVQIFYRGELDDLGNNLKNALLNNFEMVKRLTGITPSFLRE